MCWSPCRHGERSEAIQSHARKSGLLRFARNEGLNDALFSRDRLLDVSLEHALELRGDGRAHQVQRVDGKERVPDKGLNMEALDETLGLDGVKLALVLDAGERLGRRLVVGGLEDAAEQDRHIFV